MRILDKYVIRNFLYSALMWFIVFMVLRTVADLFINMDEFAKLDKSFQEKLSIVVNYYAIQQLAYFTELGGVIIVASAAFSLAMMNRTNELTAMLASGVSLRRVVLPIIICSILLNGLIVLDQEVLMPPNASRLAMDRDDPLGEDTFSVRLVSDGNGAVWFSKHYAPVERKMQNPVVLLRDEEYNGLARVSGTSATLVDGGAVFTDGQIAPLTADDLAWEKPPRYDGIYTRVNPSSLLEISGQTPEGEDPVNNVRCVDEQTGLTIEAKKFIPDPHEPLMQRGGTLIEPSFTFTLPDGRVVGIFRAPTATWVYENAQGGGKWAMESELLFPTDMTNEDLMLRTSSRWLEYLSTAELARVAKVKNLPDPGRALLTRHIRFTEPLNNLIMLLLGLPFILSRERNIKASAAMCLLTVGLFYAFVYISRYLGLSPALAAWLPTLVFGPVSVMMLDTIRT